MGIIQFIISLLVLITSGILLLFTIQIDFFPDSNFIQESLKNMHLNALILSPQYYFFQFLELFNIKISKFSLFSLISFFIINIIFLIFLIIINNIFRNKHKFSVLNSNYYLLFLSLLMPSVLLAIITPSAESLFTIISLFIMYRIMERNLNYLEILFLMILFIYCFFLDNGNGIVFLIFLLFFFFLNIVKDKVSILGLMIIFIFLLLFSYFFGKDFTLLISKLFQTSKGEEILNVIDSKGFSNLELLNYLLDISVRYLYFWSTLLGFINHLKDFIFAVIPILILLTVIGSINLYKRWNELKEYFLDPFIKITILITIFFPFLVIFNLPIHAYAKYYLFMVPILLKLLSKLINKNTLLILISSASILSTLNMFYFNFSLK